MKSKYAEKIAAKNARVISSPQANGKLAVNRFYTGLAGIETTSGLNGLVTFVNDLGA